MSTSASGSVLDKTGAGLGRLSVVLENASSLKEHDVLDRTLTDSAGKFSLTYADDFELEEGEIVEMSLPGVPHGVVCANVTRILGNYAFARRKGFVCGNAVDEDLHELPFANVGWQPHAGARARELRDGSLDRLETPEAEGPADERHHEQQHGIDECLGQPS